MTPRWSWWRLERRGDRRGAAAELCKGFVGDDGGVAVNVEGEGASG